jgi:CheY-like chemotaxis protein
MDGKVSFDKSNTGGTVFTVKVPFDIATEVKQVNSSVSPIDKPPVLIVEDNPINLMVAKAIVAKNGYPVICAVNGKEALKQLRCNDVGIVLMDCQMPIMDGFEASRHIRASKEAFRNLPIIAVTANATALDRERCSQSGMNDFLAKPICAELLSAKLNSWAGFRDTGSGSQG